MQKTLTTEQLNIEARIQKHLENMPPYVAEYCNDKMEQKFSTFTLLQYLYQIEHFFNWLREDIKIVKCTSNKKISLSDLDNLKKADVKLFFEHASKQNIVTDKKKLKAGVVQRRAESTLNNQKSALRSLFNYLANEAEHGNGDSYIDRNVMAKFPLIRERKKTTARAAKINQVILKDQQIPDFLDYVATRYELEIKNEYRKLARFKKDGLRDLAILHLFLGSGVRNGELASLELSMINHRDGSIIFKRKGSEFDSIHVEVDAMLMLKRYIDKRNELYPGAEHSPFVFVRDYGGVKELSRRAIEDIVKKYTSAYKKDKGISPHKLRHSFALDFKKANGDDLQLLSEQLGHSNMNTTALYSNMADEDRRDALERLSESRNKEK